MKHRVLEIYRSRVEQIEKEIKKHTKLRNRGIVDRLKFERKGLMTTITMLGGDDDVKTSSTK